jgi:hypothetical protein
MGNPNQPSQAIPTYNAPGAGGNTNVTRGITATTLIKSGAGAVIKAIVTVVGSGVGGIYDCTATAAAITANQVAVLPETAEIIDIEFPCTVGIFVVPGTGQQITLSWQ